MKSVLPGKEIRSRCRNRRQPRWRRFARAGSQCRPASACSAPEADGRSGFLVKALRRGWRPNSCEIRRTTLRRNRRGEGGCDPRRLQRWKGWARGCGRPRPCNCCRARPFSGPCLRAPSRFRIFGSGSTSSDPSLRDRWTPDRASPIYRVRCFRPGFWPSDCAGWNSWRELWVTCRWESTGSGLGSWDWEHWRDRTSKSWLAKAQPGKKKFFLITFMSA